MNATSRANRVGTALGLSGALSNEQPFGTITFYFSQINFEFRGKIAKFFAAIAPHVCILTRIAHGAFPCRVSCPPH